MQTKERIEKDNNLLETSDRLAVVYREETVTSNLKKPTLKLEDTGETVEELQKLLAYWGYYYDVIDGIFSRYVECAVKGFQHKVFLEEDGIVGPLTWKALYSGAPPVPPLPILRRGSSGGAVRMVQRVLLLNNYYSFDIDGLFGSITEVAVKRFQTDMNLPADGVVGPRTWHALSKMCH